MEHYPTAQGCKEFKKHVRGDRLTVKQMALAKCYDCSGYYQDGKIDCQIPDCPLYPLSPYGNHPVFKSRASQPMSEEHLKALKRGRMKGKKDNSYSIVNKVPTEASL
jgi:hypothetical protein